MCSPTHCYFLFAWVFCPPSLYYDGAAHNQGLLLPVRALHDLAQPSIEQQLTN